MVYVILNINGDIIGVANSELKAVFIYEERYSEIEYPENTESDFDKFEYLKSIDRIRAFPLNRFVYQ